MSSSEKPKDPIGEIRSRMSNPLDVLDYVGTLGQRGEEIPFEVEQYMREYLSAWDILDLVCPDWRVRLKGRAKLRELHKIALLCESDTGPRSSVGMGGRFSDRLVHALLEAESALGVPKVTHIFVGKRTAQTLLRENPTGNSIPQQHGVQQVGTFLGVALWSYDTYLGEGRIPGYHPSLTEEAELRQQELGQTLYICYVPDFLTLNSIGRRHMLVDFSVFN